MKHNRSFVRCISVLGALLFLAASLSAQPPTGTPIIALTTLAAGQSGRIGFETLTLTPTQFRQGVQEGSHSLIWGELRLPPMVTWGEFHVPNEYLELRPAVILIHGEDGLGPQEAQWAAMLNDMGVPTFVLDSFTGRGFSTPFDAANSPGQEVMIVDAYRALALLSTHPRIDPTRIALMGFSRGGAAALYASLLRFQRLYGSADVAFTAYLAFNPVCNSTFPDEDQVSERSIRIFAGTADDIAPFASCRTYIDRLRSVGKDAQMMEDPDAHHKSDMPDRQAVEAVRALLTATFEPHPRALSVTDALRLPQSR
jgi:dienelactone hydrolase